MRTTRHLAALVALSAAAGLVEAQDVQALGTVRPEAECMLGAAGDGTIIKLSVAEGQLVKQGDVLLELDSDQQRLELSAAEIRARKTEADLALVKVDAEIERANAKLADVLFQGARAQAEELRQIVETLKKDKSVVPADIQKAEFDLLDKDAAARQAQAQAEVAVLHVRQAEGRGEAAQLLIQEARVEIESAKHALDQRAIRAPFDGLVYVLKKHVAEAVAAKDALVHMIRTDRLVVDALVPAMAADPVRPGQVALVRITGFPDQLVAQGTVSLVLPSTDGVRVRVEIRTSEGTSSLLYRAVTLTIKTKA